MKGRIVSWIVLVLFFMNGVRAQEGPLMSLSVFRHDFGIINENDGPVSHVFEFDNNGTDTLKLIRLKTSSSNVTGEFVPEKVAPGAKGEIRITFDPKNEEGRVDKVISIRTNAAAYPVRQLGFIAEVVPRVKTVLDFYPVAIGNLRFKKSHIAFDQFRNTETRSDTFRLYNDGTKPMTLKITGAPAHTDWECLPAILDPGKEGMIRVVYDASKAGIWGLELETFTLSTNDSLVPEKKLSIGVNIMEDFSTLKENSKRAKINIETVTHDFGDVAAGLTVDYTYVVGNKGDTNLVIRKTKASCGCTIAKLEKEVIKPGEKGNLTISFNTSGLKGKQIKTVMVFCNDPEVPVFTLSFTANVTE